MELDASTSTYIVRLKVIRPIPPEWATMVGDVLFNLRSALDHLAFSLALCHLKTLTPGQEKSCKFPILEALPGPKEMSNIFGFFAPAPRVEIERLQPYGHNDPTGNTLWLINRLNNVDKHRTLHVVLARSKDFKVPAATNIVVKGVSSAFGFVEDGQELARIAVRRAASGRSGEISIDWAMIPCLKDVPVHLDFPVDQGLRRCLEYIKGTVIPHLEPFLI